MLVLRDHADGPDGRILDASGKDVEIVERRIAEELGNQSRIPWINSWRIRFPSMES